MKKRIRIVVIALVVLLSAAVIYLMIDESPPNDADLIVAPLNIPPNENAFTWFKLAGEKATDDPYRLTDLISGEAGPSGERVSWNAQKVDRFLRANDEAFGLIRRGLACSSIDVPVVKGYDVELPYLSQWRLIARMMALNSIALAKAGRDREALDEIVTIVAFGHMVEKGRGGIMHYVVGGAIKYIGLSTLEHVLPGVSLEPDALKDYVPQLAAYARNDDALADSFRHAYVWTAQLTDDLFDGKATVDGKKISKVGWNVFFLRNATKRLHAEVHRAAIRNIGRKPGEYEKPPWLNLKSSELTLRKNSAGVSLAALNAQGIYKVCQDSLDEQARNSAARLLIAAKWAKLKTGTLPPSLAALVPGYIDKIPDDPFDGKPMRYDPAKKVIYSIGKDLWDSGGSEGADIVVRMEF